MAPVKKIMPVRVIDNVNETRPVIDYSFCKITKTADTLSEEPRNAKEAKLSPRPGAATTNKDAEAEGSQQPALSKSRSFFLNNNVLTDLNDLIPTMEQTFEDIHNVGWLNLSFNEISTLDPLVQLPQLEILYLHGNCISDIAEVEKLGQLTKLKKATFHGNPIENNKGYRQSVLASLENLRVLDFSNITREDRTRLNSWKMVNKSKAKKKTEEEDD